MPSCGQLEEGCSSELITELKHVSSLLPKLMRELGEVSGSALASFWAARLWLSQSMLQPGDRARLLKLPVELSALFGPDVARMIKQGQEACRCAKEVSGSLKLYQDSAIAAQSTSSCFWSGRSAGPSQ